MFYGCMLRGTLCGMKRAISNRMRPISSRCCELKGEGKGIGIGGSDVRRVRDTLFRTGVDDRGLVLLVKHGLIRSENESVRLLLLWKVRRE